MPSPDPLAPKRPLVGLELARVTISRVMVGGEVVDHVEALDNAGEPLVLSDALSMLALAMQSLFQDRTLGDEAGSC